MYPIWFSMTMVVLSIVVLFFMIVKLKIHPFITMTIVAVGLALAMGMPLIDPKTGIFAVMEPAMGKQLGHMVPLIALGCVIGEIIRRSGGSEVLGEKMLQRVGNKRGPLAMTMCGLLVGSTIFFDTAVILRPSPSSIRSGWPGSSRATGPSIWTRPTTAADPRRRPGQGRPGKVTRRPLNKTRALATHPTPAAILPPSPQPWQPQPSNPPP